MDAALQEFNNLQLPSAADIKANHRTSLPDLSYLQRLLATACNPDNSNQMKNAQAELSELELNSAFPNFIIDALEMIKVHKPSDS